MRGKKSEIEIIAYEVGFNSKSAFYRAFNKYIKQSPSEFINSIS
ncbi:helix-turn-helix domain-containing protein [Bacteroidota bacterium]